MSGPLRFDQLNPARKNLIRRNLRLLESKGASEAEIEAYLRDDEGLAPAPEPTPKRGVVEDMARSAMGAIANTGPSIVSMVPAAAAGLGEALGMPESARKLRGAKDAIVQAGERASEGWNPGGSQTTPGRVAGVAAGLGTGIAAMGALPGAAALGAGAAVADPDYSVGRTAQAIRGERAKALDPNLLDTVVDNPLGRAGLEALTSLGLSGAIRAGAGVVSKAKQARAAKAMVGEPREPAAQVRGLLPAMGQPAYPTGPASEQLAGPGLPGAIPPDNSPRPTPAIKGLLPAPRPELPIERVGGPVRKQASVTQNPNALLPRADVEAMPERLSAAERRRAESKARDLVGTRARLEKRPDPTSTARLEEAAKTYRQALEQGGIVRPRSGLAAREVVTTVGSAAAGAGVGGTQGDTPEERRRNMMVGALLGAGVGIGLSRAQRTAAMRDASWKRVQEAIKDVPYANTQEGPVPGLASMAPGGDPTIPDYMQAHVVRPKATIPEIRRLAKELDVGDLELNLPRLRTLTAEQITALGGRIKTKTQELAALNQQIDAIADPAARAAAETRFSNELADLQGLYAGISKGIGEDARGLRAWQAVTGRVARAQIQAGVGSEAQAMRLARGVLGEDADNPRFQAEIRRIFSGRQGPIPNSAEAFARAVRNAKTATPGELLVDVGKTAVLGPVSFMVNITSNIASVAANRLMAQPVAAALDHLTYEVGKGLGLGGKYGFPMQRQATSSRAMQRAFARGFGQGAEQAFGISAARQAFADAGGGLKGAKAAAKTSWGRITTGIDPADPLAAIDRPHINYEASLPTWTPRFIGRGLQLMHDANYGLLDVGDRPFFQGVESSTVQELAELSASRRYDRGSPAWVNEVASMTARNPDGSWASTVPQEHQATALAEAARETYKARGRVVKATTAVANIPGFNLFIKFAQTPTNIAIETTRAMPGIGTLVDLASHWNERTGLQKILPTDRNMMVTMGRQVGVGGVAFGLGMWAYQHGFATGPYSQDPADRNARERLDQTGRKPNAFSLDGNTWMDLNVLGPLGILFNMGAASAMALEDAQGKPAGERAMSAGVYAPAQAAAQQFLDMPLMSGVKDVTDLASGIGKEGFGEQAATTLGRSVASYIPFGAYTAAAARGLDPEADRSVRGFEAPFKERLPGLRETLPSKPTALGQTIENPGAWKYFVDPTRSRTAITSPTVEVLDALGYGVRKPQKAKGEADADYQARVEVEGRYIHDRLLDALDRNADLAEAQTSVQREQAISKSITALRQQVAEAVAGEDLLVIKRALNAGEIPDADRTEVERLYLKELGARYRAALATLRTPPPPQ